MSLPRAALPAFPALRRRASTRESRPRTLVVALGLAVLSSLVFLPCVENGFTYWDDDDLVLENPIIRELSLHNLGRAFTERVDANYYPLTLVTLMVEHSLVGLDPWLYHLTNVLLHAVAVALAYLLGVRWLRDPFAALVAASLFAVHPLKVESVAWVTERKDLLYAVFWLGALLLYDTAERAERGAGLRVAAFAAFGAALLSKVMAITLPAVLVVYHLHRRDLDRRRWVKLAPWWALAIAFTAIGVLTQASDDAVKGLHGGSPSSHLATLVQSVGFYAAKLVVPWPLSPLYIVRAPETWTDPLLLLGVLVSLAAVVALALSWRRRRVALLCLGFGLVAWAPVSGLVPSGVLVADRYVYAASLGVFWLVGLGISSLRAQSDLPWRLAFRVAIGAWVVALVVSTALTWRQIPAWRDNGTLWRTALAENPDNLVAYHQLSITALREGDWTTALRLGLRAVELGFTERGQLLAIGRAYRGLGRHEEERDALRGVVTLHPGWLPARLEWARVLIADGHLAEAELALTKAPSDHPDTLRLHAEIALSRRQPRAALELLERAHAVRPADAEVSVAYAEALLESGEGRLAARVLDTLTKGPAKGIYPDVLCRLEALRASSPPASID